MQGRFMMSTQHNYAGIDIAKRNFVVSVSSLSKTKTETNNPKGIAHTVEYLKNTTSPSSSWKALALSKSPPPKPSTAQA